MKIGFVVDDTIDKPDGVQQYIIALGRWMAQNGHEVHYLTATSQRTDIPHIHSLSRNLRVRFNGNHLSIPLFSSKRAIRKVLDEVRFDVLHIQTPHSPFFAHRVAMLARSRTAVIGTFHILPHSPGVAFLTRVLGFVVRRSIRRMDTVIAVSQPAKVFADKCFGIDSLVVPNTIDLRPFFESTPIGQFKDFPTIVFLNRLEERKGCRFLLEAINVIVSEGLTRRKFRVVVCGKGPEAESLHHFAKEHSLDQYVTFMGFVSEEDKPRYLASADIAIYPSTGGESFGIVLLEGMAASRGVVLAGNNPGYAGVMGDFTDQLFEPTDIRRLAELLVHYLDNNHERLRRSSAQKDYAHSFDIKIIGPQVIDQYRNALRQRQGVG